MALIPPFFLDCVVAIGFGSEDSIEYQATGFLFGLYAEGEGDDRRYSLFMATNKHVLEGEAACWVRFDSEGDEPPKAFELTLFDAEGKQIWFSYTEEDIDLAVVRISADFLKKQNARFSHFQSDDHILTRDQDEASLLSEGDSVFVLGFPLGLIGSGRNFVLVREGIISRIRDCLASKSASFIIDASIYPGNSGGPVINRPEATAVQGTPMVSKAYLIGVVSSYIPYQDVAISKQTKRPRIIFEENSRLAYVIPADYVVELAKRAMKTLRERNQEAPVQVAESDDSGEQNPVRKG